MSNPANDVMRQRATGQSGSAILSLLFLLIPLAMILGAFLSAMNGRTERLHASIDDERALQACEAGVDAALFAGRTGALADGAHITRTLADGSTFDAEPVYLGDDGINNDGDALMDADDEDEDVFCIRVRGNSRGITRNLASYLGRTQFLPPITATVTSHNPAMNLDFGGASGISGTNTDVDGTPGDPSDSVVAIAVAPPGTTANLLGQLTVGEQNKVTGVGGTPSLGNAPPMDLAGIVDQARNAANLVLTNNTYSGFQFGNASAGTGNITFREGNVRFQGNGQGAGLLVVTGDLVIAGNFRFDGVVIVLGNVDNSAGTADINGALITGPATTLLRTRGTSSLTFSAEAIALAMQLTGRYVAFNGWQELSRN